MKIVSWNVNGIRSVYNKGLVEWFNKESPDILCLQEVKAEHDQIPEEILQLKDYSFHISPAKKKGYSGVATLSRKKILDTKKLDRSIFDDEGRVLIHEFKNYFLLNCYFPHGQRDHGRIPYKLKFCEQILKTVKDLEKKKPVIVVGDFNIAHQKIDLKNPRSNHETSGFLPEERAWMDKFLASDIIDGFRYFHPNEIDAYTWWTYRQNCRERNIGWRIDYVTFSKILLPIVKKVEHLPHIMGSDHCPVRITLK